MMLTYRRTLRTYDMNVLLITLVFLSLQTGISHCQGESSLNDIVQQVLSFY